MASRLISMRSEKPPPTPLPHSNGPDSAEGTGPVAALAEESVSLNVGTTSDLHLEYRSNTAFEKQLERDIQNFVTSIFWALERKRIETAHLDHTGKISLLCAPFERRDFVGLDLDSRVNKRRMNGRFKKHLGDLSLLCGLLKESQEYYSIACEVLKSCSDWLWLANSLEGLCSICVVVTYPTIHRPRSLRRNSSFQSWENPAAAAKTASNSNVISDSKQLRHLALTPKDLLEAFREIVVHYSNYRAAGAIETEASIKAVQVLITQNSVLYAAEFLQNIVFINLQMNDEEKVHRFSALAKLYDQIDFGRKSAFFNRVAAMRCVAPQNPRPDWYHCYHLLFQTLGGYSIDFNSPNVPAVGISQRRLGWPTLQIQILQELVGTARRMGDPLAATRHMAFLIQKFSSSLGQEDMAELCHQLSVLTAKNPGTSVSHRVEEGIILPPVNIYTIPVVKSFKPVPMEETLTPYVGAGTPAENKGPFIFTTIQRADSTAGQINWVQNEIIEVELEVLNPLRHPVEVSSMMLLHDGADFEPLPCNFVLPEGSSQEPIKIKLSGIPKDHGELRIYGYSVVICGVKSNCMWKVNSVNESFTINVCPTMPKLDASLDTDSLALDLYYGETRTAKLLLLNNCQLPVQHLSTRLTVSPGKYSEFVQLSECNHDLEPGSEAEPELKLTGVGVYRAPAPAPPLPSASSSSSNSNTFSLSINVKYSSDAEAFFRQKSLKLSVSLLPSVTLTWWDILPGESPTESYVILDLRNDTLEEIEVTYGPRKTIVIDLNSTCRIPLPIAKVRYEESEHITRKDFFEKYLVDNISLLWTMHSSERSGFVSTKAIDLSSEMISRLELSPLSWEVFINGSLWDGLDLTFPCGEPVPIKIQVTNEGKLPVDCKFSLSCSYVSEIGGESIETVAVSGNSKQVRCKSGAESKFEYRIIPCSPGRLVLKCQCFVTSNRLMTMTQDSDSSTPSAPATAVAGNAPPGSSQLTQLPDIYIALT